MLVVSEEEVVHSEEQHNREVGKRTLEEVTSNTGKDQSDDEGHLNKDVTIVISVKSSVGKETNQDERNKQETNVDEVKLETLLVKTFRHEAFNETALRGHYNYVLFLLNFFFTITSLVGVLNKSFYDDFIVQ